MQWKILKVGDKVTLLGSSTKSGDATIEAIEPKDGSIKIYFPRKEILNSKPSNGRDWEDPSFITIHDLRRLTK